MKAASPSASRATWPKHSTFCTFLRREALCGCHYHLKTSAGAREATALLPYREGGKYIAYGTLHFRRARYLQKAWRSTARCSGGAAHLALLRMTAPQGRRRHSLLHGIFQTAGAAAASLLHSAARHAERTSLPVPLLFARKRTFHLLLCRALFDTLLSRSHRDNACILRHNTCRLCRATLRANMK